MNSTPRKLRTSHFALRTSHFALRRALPLTAFALAAACFDNENDDLEILNTAQHVSVVNTNPRAMVGEAATGILPTPADQAVLTYSSLRGDRSQDSLVFVDDPTRAWEEFWADGNRDPMPPITNRGVGVSWHADCSKSGGACADRTFAATQLACNDFVTTAAAGEPKPSPIACGNGKGSSVVTRGYFSWDRGACSKRSDASEFVDSLVDGARDAMLAELDAGNPVLAALQANVRAEAQSAIWRGDRSDPQGGLAVRLRIDVSQTGVELVDPVEAATGIELPWWWPRLTPAPYSAEVRADVTAGYRWVVKDGVLGLETMHTKVTDEYGDTALLVGINGPPQHKDGKLIEALETDLPRKVAELAKEKLLYEVATVGGVVTECQTAADCVDGSSQALGFLKQNLNRAQEWSLVSETEAIALKSVVSQPSEWVCANHSGRTEKTCHMLPRAKRVNAYPNGVELVFREGGERPMTREFAIEAIARYAVAARLKDSNPMCDAPSHGAKLQMDFVNKARHATYD